MHCSSISSILETHKPTPIGQHPLVCRFLKGVFNRRPPPVCLTPTWDTGQVLMHILAVASCRELITIQVNIQGYLYAGSINSQACE